MASENTQEPSESRNPDESNEPAPNITILPLWEIRNYLSARPLLPVISGLIPGEFATPANTNLQEKIEACVHLNDIPEDVIDGLRMKSNYRDLLAIWDIPTANRDISIIHDLLESVPEDLVLWELHETPLSSDFFFQHSSTGPHITSTPAGAIWIANEEFHDRLRLFRAITGCKNYLTPYYYDPLCMGIVLHAVGMEPSVTNRGVAWAQCMFHIRATMLLLYELAEKANLDLRGNPMPASLALVYVNRTWNIHMVCLAYDDRDGRFYLAEKPLRGFNGFTNCLGFYRLSKAVVSIAEYTMKVWRPWIEKCLLPMLEKLRQGETGDRDAATVYQDEEEAEEDEDDDSDDNEDDDDDDSEEEEEEEEVEEEEEEDDTRDSSST